MTMPRGVMHTEVSEGPQFKIQTFHRRYNRSTSNSCRDTYGPFETIEGGWTMKMESMQRRRQLRTRSHGRTSTVQGGPLTPRGGHRDVKKYTELKMWEWLVRQYDYDPKAIPFRIGGGRPREEDYVKPGTRLPLPGGKLWQEMVAQYGNKKTRREQEDREAKLAEEQAMLVYTEQRLLEAFKADPKAKLIRGAQRKKNKREKAVSVGQKMPPKNFREAMYDHPDDADWIASANEEFEGLTKSGVVQHDCTLDMLAEAGVPIDKATGQVKPINLSVVLDHKYTDGVLTRYKTRLAVAGHSGNLRKGEHFDKTFAASPNANSSRILQAIMVQRGWYRKAFDITQAYIHAELPPGKRIALKYPDGFKRRDENGNELYMLMKKNLYGHPAASRAWSEHRDAYIMKHFNQPGGEWTCRQCDMDPCLFLFSRERPGAEPEQAIALIYTDDCDVIGSSPESSLSCSSALFLCLPLRSVLEPAQLPPGPRQPQLLSGWSLLVQSHDFLTSAHSFLRTAG